MSDRDSRTKASYDGIARAFSAKHQGPSRMLLFYMRDLGFLDERRIVLDIGCGNGRDSVELAKIFDLVLCLDYSRNMLSLIPDSDKFQKIFADIRDRKLSFSGVSAIWINAVIHHLSPDDQMLMVE